MSQTRWEDVFRSNDSGPLPRDRRDTPDETRDDARVFQSSVLSRTLTITAQADATILGRFHAAQSIAIDLAGLRHLTGLTNTHRTAQPWTIDGDAFVSFRGGMRPLLHHGDLHIRGSLLLDDNAWLICTGELRVDGIVSDHRASTLAVGGSLLAPRLVSAGKLVVAGDMLLSEIGLAREGAAVSVGGFLRAPNLFHHGREISADAWSVERTFDLERPAHVARAHADLVPEVFSAGGELDMDRCDQLLRCGLSILR